MDDISTAAGVSKATVSRVLNGIGNVTEETRKRVLKTMADLKYQPNSNARALSAGKTLRIGLVVEDMTRLFYRDILRAASRTASAAGYSLVISNGCNDTRIRREAIEYFLGGAADGLILVESDLLDDDYIASLADSQAPCVLVEEKLEGARVPSVSVDNRLVGCAAARHLLALGHRRIAHITGNYYFRCARLRHQGFMDAMAEAGAEVPDRHVIYADFKWSSGYSAMNILMSMQRRPTAVFAANDDMANGALRAAADLGLRVPADVSIMGVDGNKFYDEDRDLLTTIKQPTEAFGTWAVEAILGMLRGKAPEPLNLVLDFELMKGATAGPPAAER